MIRKHGTWLTVTMLVMALAAASCSSGGGGGPTAPGPGPGPGGGGGTLELNSGDIAPGGTYQHRFFTAGTFRYSCLHHSPMTGTVSVTAAATDTLVNISVVSITSSFPFASVKPGGRVVWTNNTSSVHTVTSD